MLVCNYIFKNQTFSPPGCQQQCSGDQSFIPIDSRLKGKGLAITTQREVMKFSGKEEGRIGNVKARVVKAIKTGTISFYLPKLKANF